MHISFIFEDCLKHTSPHVKIQNVIKAARITDLDNLKDHKFLYKKYYKVFIVDYALFMFPWTTIKPTKISATQEEE